MCIPSLSKYFVRRGASLKTKTNTSQNYRSSEVDYPQKQYRRFFRRNQRFSSNFGEVTAKGIGKTNLLLCGLGLREKAL